MTEPDLPWEVHPWLAFPSSLCAFSSPLLFCPPTPGLNLDQSSCAFWENHGGCHPSIVIWAMAKFRLYPFSWDNG